MAIAREPRRQYKAAPGADFTDEQAERYGRFLEEKVGLSTERPAPPKQVVEVSRPEDAPTHEQFTWDDEQAGEKLRLQEARSLVRHLVVYEGAPVPQAERFHHVTLRVETDGKEEIQRGYLKDRIIFQRPELAEQLIERARNDLQNWVNQWLPYDELEPLWERVVAALDETREE